MTDGEWIEERPTEASKGGGENIPFPGKGEGALRKDLVVAVVVLAGLFGMVLAAVILTSGGDEQPEPPQISAAQWLGRQGEFETEAESEAGESDTPKDSLAGAATSDDPASDSEEAESEAPQGDVEGNVRRGTVVGGKPVIVGLTGLGLEMSDAHALISALAGIYDFRKSRPGHTYEVRLDRETDKPVYFRYEASLTEVYEVRLRGDELVGSRKHIPTTIVPKRFGGTIASSLYKALDALGAHPTLTGKIVAVLSNQVDFYTAQRPGDTFRVIVEEESLSKEFLGYGPVLALEYNGVKSGQKRFFRFGNDKIGTTYYNEDGISVPQTFIAIPLHYDRISSPFGMRFHPVLRRRQMHTGVDFAAGFGTPVWACLEGTVLYAAKKGANGNLVAMSHSGGLSSYYAHLQRFAPGIRSGVNIRKGQVVGYVGSTGRSTGPHLHFGLKVGGRFVDPLKYKIRPGRPVPARYRSELQSTIRRYRRELEETRIKPATAPLERETEENDVLGVEEDF